MFLSHSHFSLCLLLSIQPNSSSTLPSTLIKEVNHLIIAFILFMVIPERKQNQEFYLALRNAYIWLSEIYRNNSTDLPGENHISCHGCPHDMGKAGIYRYLPSFPHCLPLVLIARYLMK